MKTITILGPSGQQIIDRACAQLSGNALKYASGDACWGLQDLTGSAKSYSSSYRNARARAAEAIKAEASKRKYVFERSEGAGGWRMELRPAAKLKRLRETFAPFIVEEAFNDPALVAAYPYNLRSPSPAQVRSAMRLGPNVVRMHVSHDSVTMLIANVSLADFSAKTRKAPNELGVRYVDCVR